MPSNGTKKRPKRKWHLRSLARLGRMPDRMLAYALARSVVEVQAMREKRGIPPAGSPTGYFLAPAVAGPSPTPDNQQAPHLGQPPNSPQRQAAAPRRASNSWRKWELDLLGKYEDEVAADVTGRTLVAVKARRRLLGRHEPGVTHTRWSPEEVLDARERRGILKSCGESNGATPLPQRFYFSLESPVGEKWSVDLEKGTLIVRKRGERVRSKRASNPSAAQWKLFWTRARALGISGWAGERLSEARGGYTWRLEIRHDYRVECGAMSRYPVPLGERVPGAAFDALLAALRRLTGEHHFQPWMPRFAELLAG